jgi:hypothetical protein
VIRAATNEGAPDGGQEVCRGARITGSRRDATTVSGGEWAAILLRRGVDRFSRPGTGNLIPWGQVTRASLWPSATRHQRAAFREALLSGGSLCGSDTAQSDDRFVSAVRAPETEE